VPFTVEGFCRELVVGEAKEADVLRRASRAGTDGVDVIEFEERTASATVTVRAHEVASETVAVHHGAASLVRDSRALARMPLGGPRRSSEALSLEPLDQAADGELEYSLEIPGGIPMTEELARQLRMRRAPSGSR
jgi:hypothetical protein